MAWGTYSFEMPSTFSRCTASHRSAPDMTSGTSMTSASTSCASLLIRATNLWLALVNPADEVVDCRGVLPVLLLSVEQGHRERLHRPVLCALVDVVSVVVHVLFLPDAHPDARVLLVGRVGERADERDARLRVVHDHACAQVCPSREAVEDVLRASEHVVRVAPVVYLHEGERDMAPALGRMPVLLVRGLLGVLGHVCRGFVLGLRRRVEVPALACDYLVQPVHGQRTATLAPSRRRDEEAKLLAHLPYHPFATPSLHLALVRSTSSPGTRLTPKTPCGPWLWRS